MGTGKPPAILTSAKFKRALVSTTDAELVMHYLVLAPEDDQRGLRATIAPPLWSAATRKHRALLWSKPAGVDEATFSDKLRRDALKYIASYFAWHSRWRRAAAGLPWLSDVAKWAAGVIGVLLGALGLQRALIGPGLRAQSAEFVTVTKPAGSSLQSKDEIRKRANHLWISRFSWERLSGLGDECRAQLTQGEPSVSCIDHALPMLAVIHGAETEELQRCDDALFEIEAWGKGKQPSQLSIPSARKFFDWDFITDALWKYGFPGASAGYDDAHARAHAKAKVEEYACLVHGVASESAFLAERLYDAREEQAGQALAVRVRNVRDEATDPLRIDQVKIDGAAYPTQVYQDDSGRLQRLPADIVFAPQAERTLTLFHATDARAMNALASGSSVHIALDNAAPWPNLPWTQTEIVLPSPPARAAWQRPAPFPPHPRSDYWNALCTRKERQTAAPTVVVKGQAPSGERAARANRTTPLDACFGPSLPLTISAHMPYVQLKAGTAAQPMQGFFVIDSGAGASFIDPAAWQGANATSELGCQSSRCSPAFFDLFGPWNHAHFGRQNYANIQGAVRQHGLLGTDFLSLDVYTIDYDQQQLHRAPAVSFCADEALKNAEFTALDSTGYFTNQTGQLLAMDVLKPLNGATGKVPNIPTIAVRIGSVVARAQIDTGFDDAQTPFSVNINLPLKNALDAAGVPLIPTGHTEPSLSTCVPGAFDAVQSFRLGSGQSFQLLGTDGSVVREYANATLMLKTSQPAAYLCGGISTFGVPAAQFGASFMLDAGAIVLDPISSRVWLPKGP